MNNKNIHQVISGIKLTYCDFYRSECEKDKCLAFQVKRPMTKDEKERKNMADIPVFDPFVHDWCIKYHKQIETTVIVENVDDNTRNRDYE